MMSDFLAWLVWALIPGPLEEELNRKLLAARKLYVERFAMAVEEAIYAIHMNAT